MNYPQKKRKGDLYRFKSILWANTHDDAVGFFFEEYPDKRQFCWNEDPSSEENCFPSPFEVPWTEAGFSIEQATGSVEDHKTCRSDTIGGDCIFIVRRDGALLLEKPALGSTVVRDMKALEFLEVDAADYPNMPDGWLQGVSIDARSPLREEGLQRGWVEAKHLVQTHEFRQVERCWPVRSIAVGDGSERLSLKVQENGTFSYRRGSASGRGHVYLTDGLMDFRTQSREPLFLAAFDGEQYRIVHQRGERVRQINFPLVPLRQHCDHIPDVR
jgi:hypothetical protein